jgi:hypothetical protein
MRETIKLSSQWEEFFNRLASFLPRIKYGINSSRNLDVVPAKAGNYKELGSRFHGKPWIPHPPIKDFEGRQVRNDKK